MRLSFNEFVPIAGETTVLFLVAKLLFSDGPIEKPNEYINLYDKLELLNTSPSQPWQQHLQLLHFLFNFGYTSSKSFPFSIQTSTWIVNIESTNVRNANSKCKHISDKWQHKESARWFMNSQYVSSFFFYNLHLIFSTPNDFLISHLDYERKLYLIEYRFICTFWGCCAFRTISRTYRLHLWPRVRRLLAPIRLGRWSLVSPRQPRAIDDNDDRWKRQMHVALANTSLLCSGQTEITQIELFMAFVDSRAAVANANFTCPPGGGAPTEFAMVYSTSRYNCSFSSALSAISSSACGSRSFSGNVSARVSAVRTADMRRFSRFHASAVKLSKYDPSVSWTLHVGIGEKKSEIIHMCACVFRTLCGSCNNWFVFMKSGFFYSKR